MKCPNCYKEIKDSAKFCRYCGTKIETHSNQTKCPKCGSQNRKDAKFCDSCGAKISMYKSQKINLQPATTINQSTDYKSSSSKTFSENKIKEKNNDGNNLILIIVIVAFIAIIGIVAISSYQNDVNTPTIEITDISLTNQYTIDVYGTPKYSDYLADKYVDDKIKVKEYTITFKALKDQDDFVLVGQNYSVSPIKKLNVSPFKLSKYTVKNADITYKPKDIKKGETYKYVIAFCNEPFFMGRDGNYNLDSLTFSYEDNGENKTIYYDGITN